VGGAALYLVSVKQTGVPEARKAAL